MLQLTRKIGIDLGTTNSRVWVDGQGIVLKEPTVVVASLESKRVVAVGEEARVMLGRAPSNMVASQPIRNGVIADYAMTEAMLRYFLQQVAGGLGGGFAFLKPDVMISVPAGSTQVERRAVNDAARGAGARSVQLIDQSLAALVGAGLPINEAAGNMVVSIGGGVAEAAVVSLGGVVASRSIRVGGNALNEAIIKHIRKQHGVGIGDEAAEQIKREIGCALDPDPNVSIEIKGRDSTQGLPRELTITAAEVHAAIQRPVAQIVEMVKKVLETVPPELASDIIDKGIVLTGGSSRLTKLDLYLKGELNVPVTVADVPEWCVIEGIGKVLKQFDAYKAALLS